MPYEWSVADSNAVHNSLRKHQTSCHRRALWIRTEAQPRVRLHLPVIHLSELVKISLAANSIRLPIPHADRAVVMCQTAVEKALYDDVIKRGNKTDFALVDMPYANKLLFQELQTINVVPRILTE